jgi:hypothetical protein
MLARIGLPGCTGKTFRAYFRGRVSTASCRAGRAFQWTAWLREELRGQAHRLANLFNLKERIGGEHGEVFELQLADRFERHVAEACDENGGAKLDHGSGGEVLLRAA